MPRRLRFKGQTLRRNIAELEVLAFKIFRGGHPPSPSLFVRDKRFRGWCGCSSETAAKCWMLLTRGGLKKGATMERFLWGLMMLTSYDTEIVGAGRVGGVDEKTFVKWAWYFVDAISFLEGDLILWENRKYNDIGNDCLVSVDGVDCLKEGKILPNGQPDKRMYSHKFKKPAYRYEVAISIRSSDIVWIAGPYDPGVYTDITIFRKALRGMLEPGERVEADDGYIGDNPQYVKCPGSIASRPDQKRMKARMRMRHETVNERLKNFSCLVNRFRHSAEKHGSCFRACACLTQIAMEAGEELFDMREYDDNLTDLAVAAIYGV